MPHARCLTLATSAAVLLATTPALAASPGPSHDASATGARERERSPADAGRITIDRVVGFGSPSYRYAAPLAMLGGLGSGGTLLAPVSASTFRIGDQTSQSLSLRPSLDVGLGKRFTFGAELGLTFDRSHLENYGASGQSATIRSTSWYVEPRIGYWIALSPHIGLWPRVGAGVGGSTSRATSTGSDIGPLRLRGSTDALSARSDVRLVAVLADHILVSFGPEASYSYVHGASTRAALGGSASLGVLF